MKEGEGGREGGRGPWEGRWWYVFGVNGILRKRGQGGVAEVNDSIQTHGERMKIRRVAVGLLRWPNFRVPSRGVTSWDQ